MNVRKDIEVDLKYNLDRDFQKYQESEAWQNGHRDWLTEFKEFSENWYRERLIDLILVVKKEINNAKQNNL